MHSSFAFLTRMPYRVLLRFTFTISDILQSIHGAFMRTSFSAVRFLISVGMISLLLTAISVSALSQVQVTNDPAYYGPFNAIFLPDGDGLKKNLVKTDSVLSSDSPWSLYAWVKPAEAMKSVSLIAGFGDPAEEFSKYLALDDGHLNLWMGKDNSLSGAAMLSPGKWHFVAATFDGQEFRLYGDGVQVASGKLDLGSVSPVLEMAPASPPTQNFAALRRSGRFSDSGAKCVKRRRNQTALPRAPRFLNRRIRRRFEAVARANPRPSRLSRASGPCHHAAQQGPVFNSGSNTCGHSGNTPTERRKPMDTGRRLADDPRSENKC